MFCRALHVIALIACLWAGSAPGVRAEWLSVKVTPKDEGAYHRQVRVEIRNTGRLMECTVTVSPRTERADDALRAWSHGAFYRNPDGQLPTEFPSERGIPLSSTEKRVAGRAICTLRLAADKLARARFEFFDSAAETSKTLGGGTVYWCNLKDFLSDTRSGKEDQTEERIVWGKVSRGLQSGLAFQGNRTRFRGGETVKLNLYWRNAGSAPVTISYATHPGSAFRPTIRTKSGERVQMIVDLVLALEEHTTVQPGQTLRVAQPMMVILGPHGLQGEEPAGQGLLPKYALTPGHYTVEVSGNERDSSVPISGSLDFEVAEKD